MKEINSGKSVCSVLRKIARQYLSLEDVYDLLVDYVHGSSNKKLKALTSLEENYRDYLYSTLDKLMYKYKIDKGHRLELYHDIAYNEGLKYVLDVSAKKFVPNDPNADKNKKEQVAKQFVSRLNLGMQAIQNNFKPMLKERNMLESLDEPIKDDEKGRSKYDVLEDPMALSPYKRMLRNETKALIREAIDNLSGEEAYVLFRYYGIEPVDHNINNLVSKLKVKRDVLVKHLYDRKEGSIPEIATELKQMTGSGSIGGVHARLKSGLANVGKHLKGLETHDASRISKIMKNANDGYKNLVSEILKDF